MAKTEEEPVIVEETETTVENDADQETEENPTIPEPDLPG